MSTYPTHITSADSRFAATVRATLLLQCLHIAMSGLWNAAGLWRIANGQAPLGPSASFLVLFLALGAGALMVWGAQKAPRWYTLASVAMALALITPIIGALVLDSSRWPTPWWRGGGLVLNGVGLAANLKGVLHGLRHSRTASTAPIA